MQGLVNNAPNIDDKNYIFWDQNPQIRILQPFSKLYDRDKSKNKSKSTKEMVVIFFMSDPDSDINKFYRIPHNERLQMLKETYFKEFDETDDLISECLVKYPHLCMTAVKRALKDEIDTLVQRGEVLRNTEYILDYYMTDEFGNLMYNNAGSPILIKGTAEQLDKLRVKSTALYDQYSKLEEKFIKEKSESRLRGGRKRNKAEKKLL